jgi:hypothetical protein
MTKLTMFLLVALAATTVGTGAAAASRGGGEISPWTTTHGGLAAPSASAAPAKRLPGQTRPPLVTVVRGMTRNIEG